MAFGLLLIRLAFGLLLIRLAFGLALAAHGAQKLFGAFGGHGLAGTLAVALGLLGAVPPLAGRSAARRRAAEG